MSFLTEPTLEQATLLVLDTAACAAAFGEAGCRFGQGIHGGFADEILASSAEPRGKEPYQ